MIGAIERSGDWTVAIDTRLPTADIALGASIACSGICLTVIASGEGFFKVQASPETLSKTTAKRWDVGSKVNLERALRVGDDLGGHLVSGHVDGLARVVGRKTESESLRFTLEVPAAFSKFLAPKGSIALDGISLTVNEVEGTRFGVNIIPHTQAMTTIAERGVSDEVNFEIDLIARYVERMLPYDRPH